MRCRRYADTDADDQEDAEEDGEDDDEGSEENNSSKEPSTPAGIIKKAVLLLLLGTLLCAVFSDPMVDAISAFSKVCASYLSQLLTVCMHFIPGIDYTAGKLCPWKGGPILDSVCHHTYFSRTEKFRVLIIR